MADLKFVAISTRKIAIDCPSERGNSRIKMRFHQSWPSITTDQ